MSESAQSHARRNPLTGEWVLVSPQRLSRPWQGQLETPDAQALPQYDADCYLCPGNTRVNGEINPDYSTPWVFENDFPSLTPSSDPGVASGELFTARAESGTCRVICYTARHDLRLSTMNASQRTAALQAMVGQFADLDTRDDIAYVQVFENRGNMMGCSNPHPHAQVWATSNIPSEPAKELAAQSAWWMEHGTVLLGEYLRAELAQGSRVIAANRHSAAVVPYWAVWPFETLLLPRRVVDSPDALGAEELACLAATLGEVLAAYDALFGVAAPYSMGLHPRPSDGEAHPEWQFHIHVYPPLLRSASIRKHLVGFEMLGMPQRDLTPEDAAAKLREHITPQGGAEADAG